jgi:hypothetical protein
VANHSVPHLAVCRILPIKGIEERQIDGHRIPGQFYAEFFFDDGNIGWVSRFTVFILTSGTPALYSVEIFANSVPRNEAKDRYGNRLFQQKVSAGKSRDQAMDEIGSETTANNVERWQIKVVEQFRFQLLEVAITSAIDYLRNGKGKIPDLREVEKRIATKIRKKITDEFLNEVAFHYNEAKRKGENPGRSLQEIYKTSERNAQTWTGQARAKGLLPEYWVMGANGKKTKFKEG